MFHPESIILCASSILISSILLFTTPYTLESLCIAALALVSLVVDLSVDQVRKGGGGGESKQPLAKYRDSPMGVVMGVTILPLVFAARVASGCDTENSIELMWNSMYCSSLIVVRFVIPGSCNYALNRHFPVDLSLVAAVIVLFDKWTALLLFAFVLYLIACLVFLPGSFTLGEAVVISTALTLISASRSSPIISLARSLPLPLQGQSEMAEVYVIIVGLILGSLFTGLLLLPIMLKLARAPASKKNQWAAAFYLGILVAIGSVIDPLITYILGVDPFIWGLRLLFANPFVNFALVVWWVCCLLCGIGLASISDMQLVPTIVRRKLYHVLVVFMFVPGIAFAPKFQGVALALALATFIFIEYLRVTRAPPFGDTIEEFMRGFTDDRDGGHAILTHMYLLIGCSVPLWFEMGTTAHSHSHSAASLGFKGFAAYSGIMVLGIGDAVASAVGSQFGSTPIYGDKTVEGLFAGVVAVIFSGICIMCTLPPYLCFQWGLGSYLWFMIATTFAMLLESFTEQIDNLFLPLFYYTLLTL